MNPKSSTSTQTTPGPTAAPRRRGRPPRPKESPPEQPLADEIAHQLEQIGDQPLVAVDDPSFVEIHNHATRWVMDLFEKHPERVPPTLAFKLFLDGTKMRNAQEVPDNTEPEPHNLLDQIAALPAPHAVGLLETEIGRLEYELAAHRQALAELQDNQ